MVFGRITEVVSDLKETLRRVFQDPPSHALPLGSLAIPVHGLPPLVAEAKGPGEALGARVVGPDLLFPIRAGRDGADFSARVRSEDAWVRWASGARVVAMPVFGAGTGRRAEVPALPRRAEPRRAAAEPFRAFAREIRAGFGRPEARGGGPALGGATARGDLALAMGLPVAVPGREVQTLSKVQWMRYSLQLVKATGENIRNLEVLGIYRIPARGVRAMRHDARTGRLLLELDRDASGAPRRPFLLARRRDDRTLVSCFLEEG